MAQFTSPKGTAQSVWREYGGWVVLMIAAYAIFSFRKVFSSLGDAAGETVAATVASTQAAAQTKAAQTKVQQATGSTTKYTDAQLAVFRADAEALAGYFKTDKNLSILERGLSFANDTAAFSMLKQKYSRLLLINNKPIVYTSGKAGDKNRKYKNVVPETSACVKNAINYKVLAPFYAEATDGRNLLADCRATLTGSSYKTVLGWVL